MVFIKWVAIAFEILSPKMHDKHNSVWFSELNEKMNLLVCNCSTVGKINRAQRTAGPPSHGCASILNY